MTVWIEPQDYDRLVLEQRNRCAICRRGRPQGSQWAVDRDEVTGEVRGLLCVCCQAALDLVGGRVEILDAMRDYIARGALARLSGRLVP